MRFASLLLLVLLTAAPAFSQTARQDHAPVVPPSDGPRIVHVTDVINRRPEAQAAMAQYQRLKEERSPLLYGAAGKRAEVYDIGDKRIFKVYNIEKTAETVVQDDIEFTLKAETDLFLIWVETAELAQGHVRDQDIEALRVALRETTPAGSVNPNAGIIANDETIFGRPPNIDGDGKSDVLLVDVRDGWTPNNGYVGGFVWGGDQSTEGNFRDILYLDTYPGMFYNGQNRGTTSIEGTAAHEYQHLIHLAYDSREVEFVNEGLSEWAEIANGYNNRSITYLENTSEHNVPFFEWRDDDAENPNLVLNDYERAGLFTTYIAERIGTTATGRIVQAANAQGFTLRGLSGYNAAIIDADTSLNLAKILADFHVANFVNDAALAPYAYSVTARQSFPVVPSTAIDGAGRLVYNRTGLEIGNGAVQYLSWDKVANLSIKIDTSSSMVPMPRSSDIKNMRTRVRLVAITEAAGGERKVQKLALGTNVFDGDFDRVTIAVIDTWPETGSYLPNLDVRSNWAVFGTGTTVAVDGPAEVPTQVTLDQNYPNPFNPTTAIRFSLPQTGTVRLAVYDMLGRHVTTLVDGVEPAGAHEVRLDAAAWSSGLYVYVLETAQQTLTKKMLLVK